jgi:putative transposase
MPRKKYTEGQIALVVKELENGAKAEDLCRKLGVSEATVYHWRKKYAGMSTPEVRRLKQL